MSVILEFTIDTDEFQLGRALSGPPHFEIELERIVPTGDMVMPFVWATGDDHASFEASVRDEPSVRSLSVLDKVGDSGLYRIEWASPPLDLIEGILEAEAVVLEARGNREWVFRLRFPDHDALSQFHNYVIEQGTQIHVDRTYTLMETTERGHRFDLTQEQREALVLALRRGYFETPSEASLDDLAAELDISGQALSDRIRVGNEKILRKSLLPSATDFE